MQSDQDNLFKPLTQAAQMVEPAAAATTTRKYKFKTGTKSLRQIRKLQNSTGLLVQRAPFKRLVQELTLEINGSCCYKKEAMEALQEASEGFLVDLFQKSITNAVRCNRTTLLVKDMQHSQGF